MESCKPLRYWHLSADEYMSHWNNPRMDVGVVSGVWLEGLAWSMCCFSRAHTCTQSKLFTEDWQNTPAVGNPGAGKDREGNRGMGVVRTLCSESMRKSESIKFSVGTLIELQNRYRNSTDSLEPLRKIKNPIKGGDPNQHTSPSFILVLFFHWIKIERLAQMGCRGNHLSPVFLLLESCYSSLP